MRPAPLWHAHVHRALCASRAGLLGAWRTAAPAAPKRHHQRHRPRSSRRLSEAQMQLPSAPCGEAVDARHPSARRARDWHRARIRRAAATAAPGKVDATVWLFDCVVNRERKRLASEWIVCFKRGIELGTQFQRVAPWHFSNEGASLVRNHFCGTSSSASACAGSSSGSRLKACPSASVSAAPRTWTAALACMARVGGEWAEGGERERERRPATRSLHRSSSSSRRECVGERGGSAGSAMTRVKGWDGGEERREGGRGR
eukprot:scaffold16167_cov28-Tisochrysis_lutea.AAC.1